MFLSKYAVCVGKISKFIKEQEASELSSNLRIKTLLSKTPSVKFLFCFKPVNTRSKINEVANNFLLVGNVSLKSI